MDGSCFLDARQTENVAVGTLHHPQRQLIKADATQERVAVELHCLQAVIGTPLVRHGRTTER